MSICIQGPAARILPLVHYKRVSFLRCLCKVPHWHYQCVVSKLLSSFQNILVISQNLTLVPVPSNSNDNIYSKFQSINIHINGL